MSTFSPSDAALSGAQVIRDHWRAVVGWAVFNVVALVAMIVVTVVVSIGVAAADGGGASQLSAALGGLIATVGTIAIEVVLVAGLYRLMQRPDEPGFIHLRVGADEMRIFGVWVVMLLGLFLLMGAVVFARSLIPAPPLAQVAMIAAGFVVAVWLGLRFSLAAPATFAERRFALATSWRLSRGHAWSLLGMSLLAACIVALISLASWVLMFLASGLGAGFGSVFEAMTDPEALKIHPGLYLAQMAFELVLAPFLVVLGAAPAMAAYQALTREG